MMEQFMIVSGVAGGARQPAAQATMFLLLRCCFITSLLLITLNQVNDKKASGRFCQLRVVEGFFLNSN
jgi:hypothetical protein